MQEFSAHEPSQEVLSEDPALRSLFELFDDLEVSPASGAQLMISEGLGEKLYKQAKDVDSSEAALAALFVENIFIKAKQEGFQFGQETSVPNGSLLDPKVIRRFRNLPEIVQNQKRGCLLALIPAKQKIYSFDVAAYNSALSEIKIFIDENLPLPKSYSSPQAQTPLVGTSALEYLDSKSRGKLVLTQIEQGNLDSFDINKFCSVLGNLDSTDRAKAVFAITDRNLDLLSNPKNICSILDYLNSAARSEFILKLIDEAGRTDFNCNEICSILEYLDSKTRTAVVYLLIEVNPAFVRTDKDLQSVLSYLNSDARSKILLNRQ